MSSDPHTRPPEVPDGYRPLHAHKSGAYMAWVGGRQLTFGHWGRRHKGRMIKMRPIQKQLDAALAALEKHFKDNPEDRPKRGRYALPQQPTPIVARVTGETTATVSPVLPEADKKPTPEPKPGLGYSVASELHEGKLYIVIVGRARARIPVADIANIQPSGSGVALTLRAGTTLNLPVSAAAILQEIVPQFLQLVAAQKAQ